MLSRLLALVLLLAGVPALHAQTVQGTVVEAGSGQGIAAVQATLLDAGGRAVAGTRTGADGTFTLQAAAPGTYTVRVDRIGYGRTVSAPLSLRAGQVQPLRLTANQQRVSLEGIVVSTRRRRCALRPDGAETAEVWEEARKALQSTAATERSRLYRYSAAVFERQVDAATGTIAGTTQRTLSGAGGTPFLAAPAARLAEVGFVAEDRDSLVYYAPDAATLLSDVFLNGHCFHLEAAPDSLPGVVGLAFRPVGNSRLPDVEGVLWLDRASAELRSLEYEYTRLPGGIPAHQGGGRVDFRRLPEGDFIVSRWVIRMPVLQAQTMVNSRAPGAQPQQRTRVVGRLERGGELTALTRGGVRVPMEAGALLAGVVWDSTRAAPLAGARVSLAGVALSATTDAAGRFELRDVPEGRYAVAVSSARLDSLGISILPTAVNVSRRATPAVELAVPSLARGLAAVCADSAGGAGTGVLVGRVRGDAGAVAGARVSVASAGQEPGGPPLLARTDARGVYRVCAAPAGSALAVSVDVPNASRTLNTVVQLGAGQTALQDFTVSTPAATLAATPAARRPADGTGTGAGLLARVVGDADGQPIAGASVRVGTGTARTTDAQGRVRLGAVAAGNHQVTVAHPSLGTRVVRAALSPEAVDLELRVPQDTTRTLVASVTRQYRLEGLTATAERQALMLGNVGFLQRQRTAGSGRFFDADELEGLVGSTPDILRRIGQVRTVEYQPPPPPGSNVRPDPETRIEGRSMGCWMEVWVDGVLMQANSTRQQIDLDAIPIPRMAAVEIYRTAAGIPAQYITRTSRCGVILIWTEGLVGRK